MRSSSSGEVVRKTHEPGLLLIKTIQPLLLQSYAVAGVVLLMGIQF